MMEPQLSCFFHSIDVEVSGFGFTTYPSRTLRLSEINEVEIEMKLY